MERFGDLYSARTYTMFVQNINKASIEVDEYLLQSRQKELKQNDNIENKLTLEALQEQFDDYMLFKDLSKSDIGRDRKINKLNLIGDRYSILASNGLVKHTFPFEYVFDLSEHLDLAIALAFDEELKVCSDNLKELCERKGLSKWLISKMFLSQNIKNNILNDYDFTLGDILSLSPLMKEFFISALNKAHNEDLNILDCISSYSYSAMVNIKEDQCIPSAVSIKILTGIEETLMKLLYTIKYDLQTNGIQCDIASKFIPGFVIRTSQPLPRDYRVPIRNIGYYNIPIKMIKGVSLC